MASRASPLNVRYGFRRDVIAGSFDWSTLTSGTLDPAYDNSEGVAENVQRPSITTGRPMRPDPCRRTADAGPSPKARPVAAPNSDPPSQPLGRPPPTTATR